MSESDYEGQWQKFCEKTGGGKKAGNFTEKIFVNQEALTMGTRAADESTSVVKRTR